MNNFVARVFSGMLSLLHFLVGAILVGGLIFDFIRPESYSKAIGGSMFMQFLALLGVFLLYIIIVGFFATIVSMNDNLNEIKTILRQISKDEYSKEETDSIPVLHNQREKSFRQEPKIG